MELDGGNPLYYDSRGLTNAAMGQENAALADMGKAIALKPDYAVYYDHRSSVCLSMGLLSEALEDASKAITLAPDFDAFHDSRGYLYYEMGDYQNAHFDFLRAAELDPSNAEYQADAGAALFQLGRYEEAVMKLSTSIAQNERLDYAYSYRGLAKMKLALSQNRPPDTPDILRDVSYAIELQPSYKNYLRRGQYYLLAGNAENALRDLRKAESQTMDFPSADIAHWLSLAYGRLSNDLLAQKYQNKAARLGFREKPEP